MSYDIQSIMGQQPTLLDYISTVKKNNSLYSNAMAGAGTDNNVWNYYSDQADVKVSMAFQNISEKVVYDLAEVTADYLADKPELKEDYVLVVVENSSEGRLIKAFHREDLVADLEGEEREAALEAFKENKLVSVASLDELPEDSDDPELLELAAKAQDFIDRNKDVLDILGREGYLPWEA